MITTKERAILEAGQLSQRVGFMNFSIQQVAEKLGIKQPSLYQHFRSKNHLGEELIRHYRARFEAWRANVEDFDPREQIAGYFGLAFKHCVTGQICGFAALLGDYNALPKALRKSVNRMLDDQRKWLAATIAVGQKAKLFRKDKSGAELTEFVVANYVGAQMVARISGRTACVETVSAAVLEYLQLTKKK